MFSRFFGAGEGGANADPYGQPAGGPPPANSIFIRSYKVYSPAFIGKPEVNKGNKIILPSSALNELARLRISYPMTFMISNPQISKKSYCGVLEFSAEEGMCHLPVWLMHNLFLEEGSEVILRNVNLKKGTFMKIQPHETAFIDLPDPKAILEREMTNYSCIFKGDTININH
jgi:ubiquitin fusion degradation protein 1